MQVKAIAKNVGYSFQKVKLIADTVRGKRLEDALAVLRFLPSPAARAVAKVVKSAAANAENNYQLTPGTLKIVSVFANQGRTMRRFRPRARGRANEVLRRSSHITVILEEQEG